ncbi:MAG: GGDEF domain-containing protein [Ruminococcus sp.]|nr:GGDEF domain-containing protein [Ruminococcus sp.]
MARKKICFVTAQPESNHSHKLMKGIFKQCEKYGLDVAVFASMINLDFYYTDYATGERNIYKLINVDKFDGVILDNINLTQSQVTDDIEHIYKSLCKSPDTPVIGIGTPYADIPTVKNKNEEVIREICRHMIEFHGCKDICILTGHKDNSEAEERLSIILDETKRHGLKVSDDHIIYGDFWYSSGEQLANDIADGKISKPDAIIAASDHMALGAIEMLTKLNIKVPDEIKVFGFDATMEASLDDISLTTIESNFAKCGADAVDELISKFSPETELDPYIPDAHKMIHIGMSCGCIPDISVTVNSLKSMLYFTTRNYTADIFNDNIDIGLLMESYIPEKLTSSQDPEELIKNIHDLSYIASPYEAFYLCLKDDWLDSDKDIAHGYPDDMHIAFISSYVKGDFDKYKNRIHFKASEMLPQMYEDREEPNAFYFTPLHFRDKALGYAVLQRKLKDVSKMNLVYRNWIRFINTALEMTRSKNRLSELSVLDKMTGLYNRRGMFERYEKMLENAKDTDKVFACVIDMDGLKYINDTYGHQEGDIGIIAVSKAASQVSDEDEICVRSGGDEFYIIGIGEYDEKTIERKTERFNAALKKLSDENGKQYPISASIGCSIAELDSELKIDDLLINADEQMYHNKLKRKMQRRR